jgi:RimJ/RimL family protein N-acetyltransferase
LDFDKFHIHSWRHDLSDLLFGCDEAVAGWVQDRIPHVARGFGPCAAIGVYSGNKMLAGVVYHDFQPEFGTIQISMAADNPMWSRKKHLRALLSYPFNQIGAYKVWTATPHDNEAALRVNLHIGFKKEATLAHHFGRRRHAVICRMLKPDYIRIFGE